MVLGTLKNKFSLKKVAKGARYVKTLTLRSLPTDAHRKHWKDWLGVLYVRAYFCLLTDFIFMTVEYAIGSNRASLSREFLETDEALANRD